MVGYEGCGPVEVVQKTRAKAVNPNYPTMLFREFDLLPREDGQQWKVGDEVGLNGGRWTERNGAEVYAVITEIVSV
jgi:hypothetical protein